jgi:photosystem II stability/assembly factor-like uncharacterized protein
VPRLPRDPDERYAEPGEGIAEDPAARRRRLFVGATVALLALGTGYLVYATTRGDPAPAAPAALAPGVGAIALSPSHAWRWAADTECERGLGVAGTTVERRDGTAWVGADVPLSTVRRLSFADDTHGVALGTDERCLAAAAATGDGGATWSRLDGHPVAVDVAKGAAWRVTADAAGDRSVEHAPDAGGPWTAASRPCTNDDGDLSDVVAVSATAAWAVCEGPAVGLRLLLRTADAGATWERRVDNRESTGLSGDGTIRRLVIGTAPRGWVFLAGGDRCPEGELRTTADTGLTWAPLPCPAASAPLRAVLDVALRPDGTGLLLGISRGKRVLLATADGARTWHAEP